MEVVITYSTNWMGPINEDWIAKHGTCWSAGRIDIRDDSKHGYDGWYEYSLPPMHKEDWNDFSGWLWDFQTNDLWEFDDIIAQYEDVSGKKIRWADE